MKSIQRYVNTHDVHSMMVLPDEINRVISIGVDGNLFVDNPRKKSSLTSYPPFQWGNNVVVASQAKILCLKHENSIEVWKLGNSQNPSSTPSNLDDNMIMDFDQNLERKPVEILKLTDEPIKVLEIKCNEIETIHNMAISSCGKYLAFCTKTKLKLLKISIEPEEPQIEKISISIKRVPHLLTFGNEDNKLFVADSAGHLSLFTFDNESATLQNVLKFDQGISHLVADGVDMCVVGKYNLIN